MANYTYVVDSSYQPFSLQEMLVPFNAYKEAFEKSEDVYDKLSEADDFKYLSKTLPEGSAARSLYEGYANDLHSQAEDLAQNGLTMGNRRALTSLKRRYRGEIGQLVKADEALKEEKKLRQTLNAQDPERLYATENLSIDDFLEGKNPNLYSISGKDLYARGAQAAKAYSSRVFNTSEGPKTLGGYFRTWIQRNGTSNESISEFMKNMQSIPEMYNAFNSIMKATGAEKNLSGYSLERAREEVLNGMVDGFAYTEKQDLQRDPGVMSATEKAQNDLAMYGAGVKRDNNGNLVADETNINYKDKSLDLQAKQAAMDTTYQYDEEEEKWKYSDDYIKTARALKGKGTTTISSNSDGTTTVENDDTDDDEQKQIKKEAQTLSNNLQNKKSSNGDPINLANNDGFDVITKNNKYHYDYAGAIKNAQTKNLIGESGPMHYVSGKIGDDVPDRPFGFWTSSNVTDWWGDFSAKAAKGTDMRVLTPAEVAKIAGNADLANTEGSLASHIYKLAANYLQEKVPGKVNEAKEALKKNGVAVNNYNLVNTMGASIEIIEVPNTSGVSRKGYLVAVQTN